MWVLFVITQVADGVLTYLGLHTFGTAIEGNPIVAWYIAALGATAALVAAKLVSVACAAVLHLQHRHRVVALLTGMYLLAAVDVD